MYVHILLCHILLLKIDIKMLLFYFSIEIEKKLQ